MISLVLASLLAASSAAPRPRALIVTNNRSLDLARPDLHYADDDGVQYAQLFGELFGKERVTLLTQLDAETTALHPELAGAKLKAPTLENVLAEVDTLSRELANERDSELFLVFAGHGDIDRGQGYLDLANGRLTARDLDEKVIARLPAARIHLLLDSCNSYFLLNPRKPGGTRWVNQADTAQGLLTKYPNLGALISTSAEAVTYEWSELQSGIFSYEIRSGLRGAADANADGKVTYSELNAFLTIANRSVVNDLYRPKVFARGPGGDSSALLTSIRDVAGNRLRVVAPGARRLTLRDRQGVRILDVNKEDGTELALILPEETGVGLYERASKGERTVTLFRELHSGEEVLDAAPTRSAELASRGEAPVFQSLFQQSFGRLSYAQFEDERARAPAELAPTGVTVADVERLHINLIGDAENAKMKRLSTAFSSYGVGITLVALTVGLSVGTSEPVHPLIPALTGGAGAGLIIGSTLSLFLRTPMESLAAEWDELDWSSEQARAESLAKMESRLRTLAADARFARRLSGILGLVTSGVTLGLSSYLIYNSLRSTGRIELFGPTYAGLGVGLIGASIYTLVGYREPVEVTWERYTSDPAVRQKGLPPAEDERGASLQFNLAPSANGFSAGLSGTF